MRQIDEFFSSPPANTTLYHYTGIGALLGMVETCRIWASHAYYLSDSSEILHACDVLRGVLSKDVDNYSEEEKDFVKEFKEWLDTFRDTPHHIYVFSLSEEPSLLSQWRSYTPHGKGVSIGFSATGLKEILKGSGFRIARCLYEPAEQRELMAGLLEKMLTTFRQRLSNLDISGRPPTQKYYTYLEEFRGEILQVLAIIKQSAFSEEREWRIVSSHFPSYIGQEIKFREGASMLLPYIEIELSGRGKDAPLFEIVILGPSQHANLSMAALSNFLSNKRACNATQNCVIPYRKW